MTLAKVLAWEGNAFLILLGSMLVYRLLTRQIRLDGLLARTGGQDGEVSPERVQLLLATIAMCMRYVMQVAHGSTGAMPDVDHNWLYLYGGSSGLYAAVKTALSLRGPERNSGA